ncbi:restriction endonuclease subunit S [Nocardia grenadensis]
MSSEVNLGSVADFINGVAFKPADWTDTPDSLPIIRIQNLNDPTKPYNRTTRRVAERHVARTGDLLVSWSASLGVFTWPNTEPGLVNQHIFKVVPRKDRIDANYLRHSLVMALGRMSKHLHGATMKHINRGEFLSEKIRLPEMSEQQRIAEVLDRVDALREKRRKSITLLDDLAQSIFLDMFGDPVKNERGWPSGTVSDIVSEFQSGKSLAQASDDSESSIRILKISAVTSGIFAESESKPAPADYIPPAAHFVKNGDLLFSRANTAELIGATAIVETGLSNLVLPDKLWRFHWKDKTATNPQFVNFLFRQPSFREQISRAATGSSGSMKNISQSKVMALRTAIPPADLQFNFGARVSQVSQQRSAAVHHLQHLDALFASIQSRAFRGELWQDDLKEL